MAFPIKRFARLRQCAGQDFASPAIGCGLVDVGQCAGFCRAIEF
ncbi:hypothetical protein ACFOHY_20755 [Rhizobium rosettiformans]